MIAIASIYCSVALYILNQGASKKYIDDLHASAHTKNWSSQRYKPVYQFQLYPIPLRLQTIRRCILLAVPLWLQISSAG